MFVMLVMHSPHFLLSYCFNILCYVSHFLLHYEENNYALSFDRSQVHVGSTLKELLLVIHLWNKYIFGQSRATTEASLFFCFEIILSHFSSNRILLALHDASLNIYEDINRKIEELKADNSLEGMKTVMTFLD